MDIIDNFDRTDLALKLAPIPFDPTTLSIMAFSITTLRMTTFAITVN